MNNNKNILVVGATGNIGQEVLKTFTKKNIAVKAMTKDVTKVKNTETIEWIFGDFTKNEQPDGNVTAVVDIFRVKNKKIVEHWDIMQAVPEKAANSHPCFRKKITLPLTRCF